MTLIELALWPLKQWNRARCFWSGHDYMLSEPQQGWVLHVCTRYGCEQGWPK